MASQETIRIDAITIPGNKKIDLVDTLNELKDVQLSVLSNGQALVYDSTLGKWKNAVISGGGGSGASTLADLSDTDISNPSQYQALIYSQGSWKNMNLYPTGLTKKNAAYSISTSDVREIDLSNEIDTEFDILDMYVEIDGTVSPAPINVNALPNECVNIFLKNTNVSNAQGVVVRFIFDSSFSDYTIYDDGNIRYNASYAEITIPRNKTIEASLKKYSDLEDNDIISIVYSDPMIIQAI